MAKTKAQLLDDIAALKKQLSSAQEEMNTADRVEGKEKAATELYEQYEAFKVAGFTDEQAWELLRIIVDNNTQPKRLF